MMKKFTSLFILFFTFFGIGFSQQRNAEQALKVASEFLNSKNTQLKTTSKTPRELSLVYTDASRSNTRSSKVEANFYVFNVDKTSGFVIVSGDERALDIIGYSSESHFDENNIPENFKYWLSYYKEEIELVKKSGTALSSNKEKQAYASSVAPLLGNIKWNQSSPYNNLCPIYSGSNRAVTGCVATAMAQVMKYHKWPVKGIGSNSYTSTNYGISLSADFSKTTYDWNNMTPAYGSQSTTVENNAVATLMFHCGVAVNMNYGPSSGANFNNTRKALIENFDYDRTMQYITRDYFTQKDWNDLIKNEIDDKRPVLYEGQSTTGGHAFVCDGYDNAGLFHINWGWGGNSDGYFALSALTPATQGIGGSSGGYNFGQGAIVGIQKNKGNTESPLYFVASIKSTPSSSVNVNQNFQIIYDIRNRGLDPVTAIVNLALYDSNGNFVTTLYGGMQTAELATGWGYTDLTPNCKVPSTVGEGNYELHAVYRKSSESSWTKASQLLGGNVAVTVAGSKVTFVISKPELKLNSLTAKNSLYENKTGNFEASISNDGKLDLLSMMALKFVSKANGSIHYMSNDPVVIGKGDTEIINFSSNITIPVGNYDLYVVYNTTNTQSNQSPDYNDYEAVGNSIEVKIAAAPVVNELKLELISASFPDKNNVTPNTFNFTVTLKNTGDHFDHEFYISYNDPKVDNTYYRIEAKKIILEPGETGTYTFIAAPSIPVGDYNIGIIYRDLKNSAKWLHTSSFSFKEDVTTNIDQEVNEVITSVYPNPTTDILYLDTQLLVKKLYVYDLAGKQVLSMIPNKEGRIEIDVQNLIQGTYVLRAITEDGVQNIKFIKK